MFCITEFIKFIDSLVSDAIDEVHSWGLTEIFHHLSFTPLSEDRCCCVVIRECGVVAMCGKWRNGNESWRVIFFDFSFGTGAPLPPSAPSPPSPWLWSAGGWGARGEWRSADSEFPPSARSSLFSSPYPLIAIPPHLILFTPSSLLTPHTLLFRFFNTNKTSESRHEHLSHSLHPLTGHSSHCNLFLKFNQIKTVDLETHTISSPRESISPHRVNQRLSLLSFSSLRECLSFSLLSPNWSHCWNRFLSLGSLFTLSPSLPLSNSGAVL